MLVVDIVFLGYLVVCAGYLGTPFVRSRCIVLQPLAIRFILGALLALVAAELLSRSLLVDDRSVANVTAAVAASGVILVFGAVALSRISGWLILNYHADHAQHLAAHTLSLLGFAYEIDGRQINVTHPAGRVYVGPFAPGCVRVRFDTPHVSPRFTLFVSGYRKQLIFARVRSSKPEPVVST